MSRMKPSTVATLLGDIVDSRHHPDRQALHGRLITVLDEVNAQVHPLTPLEVTAGDEYQGTYPTLGDALEAAFRIQVGLRPDIDSRTGLGWGAVTLLDTSRNTQDGPGWWAARDAIESVEAQSRTAALSRARTAYRANDSTGPDPVPINAALLGRDHLVGSLDDRSQRILAGLMLGATQQDLAAIEGISASAVSQRVRRDGLGVILATQELLGSIK